MLMDVDTFRDDWNIGTSVHLYSDNPKRMLGSQSQTPTPGAHDGHPTTALVVPVLEDGNGQQDASLTGPICFGTLPRVVLPARNIHSSKVIFPKATVHFQANGTIHAACNLNFHAGRCTIKGYDQDVGVLPDHLCQVLSDLRDCQAVHFDCILAVVEGHNLLVRELKEDVLVDINVYGENGHGHEVGMKLANADLFLQTPDWTHGLEYRNPQLYELPQFGPTDVANVVLPWKSEVVQQSRPTTVDITTERLDEVPNVIEHFAAHQDLVQANADVRVKTPLLGHQRQALEFMLTREAGSSQPPLSLWEDISSGDSNKLFQHRITGAKSPIRQEAPGGILADDMGLGKSLSVLATVAGTLQQAESHAFLVTNMTAQEMRHKPLPAKSTLVLVPSTLLMLSWQEELRRHIHDRALGVYEYHGNRRNVDLKELLQNDIVITTYATLSTEFRRKRTLHGVHWYRVVLDEAHVIRNSTTRQFKAAAALSSRHRWCLTGTPIQNSLEDLSSLIQFLRLPLLDIPVQFRRHIVAKIENVQAGVAKDFENLRTLLEAICLRRNKSVLDVPPSEETERVLEFSSEEKTAYKALSHRCSEAMDAAVAGHRSKETHQTVLHALLRLRMFCNNTSYYGHPDGWTLTSSEEIQSLLQQDSEEAILCHYCTAELLFLNWSDEEEEVGRVTGCQKFVCKHCLQEHRLQAKEQSCCPACKGHHELFLNFQNGDKKGTGPFPTKLLALVEEVKRLRVDGLNGKRIIFSFWKESLNIVGELLTRENIPFLRVDGSLRTSERSRILSEFEAGEKNNMLLMTFSTGAVGLNNLSVATHVHILEPQWNPSVESQAVGRLVRLGQKHCVQVVRYLMEDTVEMSVTTRQSKKKTLARDGFDSGSTELETGSRLNQVLENWRRT